MTRKTHVARPWLIKKPMTVTMMLMKLYEISSSIMHPKLRFRFLIEQQTKKSDMNIQRLQTAVEIYIFIIDISVF